MGKSSQTFSPVSLLRAMLPSGEHHASWIEPDEEGLLERFEESWRAHPPADLAPFLAEAESTLGSVPPSLLEELVKVDLEYRWRHYGVAAAAEPQSPTLQGAIEGELPATPRIEDYRARYPQLGISLELIAEEYRVRCRWGDHPSPAEYVR